MNIPKQTAEIFGLLSKGQFISSNGSNGKLFDVLHDEENFRVLKEYFGHIGYTLESGYNYYYFSQKGEQNMVLEKKLEQLASFIDLLDFFSCLDSKPVPGTRYRVTKVAEECYANERLKQKIFALSRKEKLADKVTEAADSFCSAGFFEKEDEETYKVMDAIHYLEQVIMLITIEEDGEKKTDSQ
ncbi:hypothetical protein RCC89_18405 [Cytophagaceae bacterium ABcell3]|nr:hypothetical protein RCC89_18405 [Cytophagaceae bacterium ABcell3]